MTPIILKKCEKMSKTMLNFKFHWSLPFIIQTKFFFSLNKSFGVMSQVYWYSQIDTSDCVQFCICFYFYSMWNEEFSSWIVNLIFKIVINIYFYQNIFRFKKIQSRCLNQLKKNWKSNCHSVLRSIHGSQTPTKHVTAHNHSSTSIDVRNCVEKTINHATISKRFSITFAQIHGLKNGKTKSATEPSQFRSKHKHISINKREPSLSERMLPA